MTIIIPSKDINNLTACLRALRFNEPDAQIVVVDDGIPVHDLYDAARSVPQPFTVVSGAKPFVFARNVNLGIAAAERDDIVILNDDALLATRDGFSRMQRAQKEHPEYGLVGAVTHHTGNQNQFPQGGQGLIPGLREDPRMVCFVAVYIPRSTIDRVGLLDEDFTDYGYEDDDYCLRVRRAGLKIGIHDGCYVDHGSLTSSYRGAPYGQREMSKNAAVFIRKWGRHNPKVTDSAIAKDVVQ